MIIPSNYSRSSSSIMPDNSEDHSNRDLVRSSSSGVSFPRFNKPRGAFTTLIRSLMNIISFPTIFPTCMGLNVASQLPIIPSLGRKVTGTLFGHRRGHVSFAVQDDPRSEPVFIIEFAMSTSTLVKEMSSGLVRIALECEKGSSHPPTRIRQTRLFSEPVWTMYCNGRKCGHAVSRACNDSDWHVLSTVQTVSVGAGVIPLVEDGSNGGGWGSELLYMRARFERVVGSRDSEAFYMLNPDETKIGKAYSNRHVGRTKCQDLVLFLIPF
ncbi:hypothetical protein Leryth_001134 [Lithospermum erythrorhizon]|nr:hypothetical protein Leryth_001134 [Lithospermum erythrorhizon]